MAEINENDIKLININGVMKENIINKRKHLAWCMYENEQPVWKSSAPSANHSSHGLRLNAVADSGLNIKLSSVQLAGTSVLCCAGGLSRLSMLAGAAEMCPQWESYKLCIGLIMQWSSAEM